MSTADRIAELDERPLDGTRVFVRVDHNVPISRSGDVTDETRLVRTVPTIARLLERRARVIVLTHWGYPGGRHDPRLSTARLAERLASHVDAPIRFCDSADPGVLGVQADAIEPGELLYVENLRFLPGEERNDAALAIAWSRSADLYVADAFSVCHRRHASVAALASYVPAVAGPSFAQEHRQLAAILTGPRPRGLVLGGAKVDQKLALLPQLMRHFDVVALGGRCAVHMAAQRDAFSTSHEANDSLADLRDATVLLPDDWRTMEQTTSSVTSAAVRDPAEIVDVGEESIERMIAALRSCRTIFWNGPLGRYEDAAGIGATRTLIATLADLTRQGVQTAAGGGDTVAALHAIDASAVGFVSVAGGAALAYLAAGNALPGILPLLATRTASDRA